MASSREIKDGYTSTLQDLTCNSKPLISVLTMLAEENVAHAKDIVEAIETHLAKVPTDVKLPVLYLIDCIIKNVGGPYLSAFCNNIVPLFCGVFKVVDEKTRTEMYKLRQTWNDVIPKNKLYALDVQTKQMDPAWPITAAPPNIHFNPKFLKSTEPTAKPLAPIVDVPGASDPATLDMHKKLIIKQKELLELQQKKLELELLQTQVKLQEQLKKTNTKQEEKTNPLLKPEVAKQLKEESGEIKHSVVLSSRVQNNCTSVPKIAPVNSALIAASRPIRDPRLLRQQAAQQNSVNSIVQLENKSNTTNTLDNKIVSNKMSNRVERTDARFVNNKDELLPKTKALSRIPLKSKRSTSPSNKSSGKSNRGSKSSGSGSTSSLDSPTKSKSSQSSSKSPTKYKKGPAGRSDLKKSNKNKADRKSPNKESGFKDMKGSTKNRNYIRRNREMSLSPEMDIHDIDLRVGGPPEKQPRVHNNENKEEKSMDVDLRHMPAMVGKKRPSMESSETPLAKKNKSEVFDVLFGNEDTDLRQFPVMTSPKNTDRPPTPPPPIISNKPQGSGKYEKENTNGSPKNESSPKANLEALRAKLANATNKDKFNKSRFNLQVEQKKLQDKDKNAPSLDNSLSQIIISPADEECIKAGNMTKAQESALMNKIIAQIENQKLKEAKRKDSECDNIQFQAISDEDMDSEGHENADSEKQKSNKGNDRLQPPEDFPKHSGFDSRFRRGPGPMWRGVRRGFPGPRTPIRPQRPGIEPWIRPLNPNPQWRTPIFHNNIFEEDKMDIEHRSNSPISQDVDLVVNCASQDNTKSINIDGEPRDIIFYDETAIAFMTWEDPREISFQNGVRRVVFDDKDVYSLSFNEGYKEVLVNGNLHKVRLGAPTREIYIDGSGYECFFGGPGVAIELDGKLTVVKIDGPPPQVKIGTVRRTDLVAGNIKLIIDAKTIVPIYLDARTQKFDIDGKVHTLKFTDALQTVLINDTPFKVEFGGLPKPITVNDKKHFVRFSVLPKGVKPGYVNIKDMEGMRPLVPSDHENSQDGFEVAAPTAPVVAKKKSRFSDDSPDRNSNSPNTAIQNLLQQPTFGNFDSILSNVLAASASISTTKQNVSAYQIDNTMNEPAEQPVAEVKPPPLLPPPTLPPNLNINDLFQKLVATGIVTSTIPASAPQIQTPIIPAVTQLEIEKLENAPTKQKKLDMVLKHVDFNKPNTLKLRQPALLNALYSGMQCSSCGMRFPPENSMFYSQHLDWHFRQNRKGKKNIRKATSRRWYYSIADWNNYEEIEDLEEREKCYFENQQKETADGTNEEGEEEIEIPSVPADSNVPDPHCEVCQEKFEQFYNEEKEEWHLRMAVRIDGQTYHPLCFEDYQASLVDTTMDETLNQSLEKEVSNASIPGLEVPLDEPKEEDSDMPQIIIDDVESIESVANTPLAEEEKIDNEEIPMEHEDDDDDVIINEIQPERIILDEYEFKGTVDVDGLIPGVVIKQEPVDDGFMDVENFKLTDVKIKTEAVTPDESFEDIGQITSEAATTPIVKDKLSTGGTHADLLATIDGNVDLNANPGVPPAIGISGKIKLNISKPLPVIAPKENKDISLDVDNNIEPIDPTQPLPPGEEPVQLHLKPALQGIELKKLPPVNKGSELTGLCSIM